MAGRMIYTVSSKQALGEVINVLSRQRVLYAAVEGEKGDYHLVRADAWEPERHVLAPYRTVEPLKQVVFPPREFLGRLWSEPELRVEERIVVGVKNCDLSALRIHDYVFAEDEPPDSRYTLLREKTLLVTADCTDCRDACFCPAVEEQPYPVKDFDINISPVGDHWLLEAGSEKGERTLALAADLMQEATPDQVQRRDDRRRELYEKVKSQAEQFGLAPGADYQKALQQAFESELWDEFARDCVECGACNFACCTCHCFMLADGYDPGGVPARVREWDSCLFKNFARVAGGANPREHRAARLRNRFDKKFNFFVSIMGKPACDGCGRCIEACLGRIDIRKVLRRMLDES